MLAFLMVLLTQVPCTAQDVVSPICKCKQGMASACEALRQTEPELANRLEAAFHAAQKVEETTREADEALRTKNESSCDSSAKPPECKGQWHHIISKLIAEALKDHKTLHGHYKARDPRFVSRAVDEQSHCGYQFWHRDVDQEVVAWLREHREATQKQFEAYLRDIYKRPGMRARFPHGF
jgi:erythromycin esterase-like protein